MQKNSSLQEEKEDESGLNYLDKKLFHMIELQTMDIENSLHYMQKKHALSQIKESLAQIYSIFNQTEPLFRVVKGSFLHEVVKKLMNCFGIIYLTLMEHIERGAKDSNYFQPPPHVNRENINKQQANNENELPNVSTTQLQTKSHQMGGIALYNENYTRHINRNNLNKLKHLQSKQQLTKQQFNQQVRDQLNQSPQKTYPDENIDIFALKFKHARGNSTTAFHDELQSISNFFRQSQNEAFQFLNKTKDQNAAMNYDDQFQNTLVKMKIQNERKMSQFAEKIRAAFRSIKCKTESNLQTKQNKMKKSQKLEQMVLHPLCHDEQTQTEINIEEELKALHKKISDAEQRYSIMVQVKSKELHESLALGMQLQNQLGIKNREVVYLKLKIEEQALVISSLNKRLKFFNEHRKITQKSILSKNSLESSKVEIEQQIKEKASEPNLEDEQQALESIRKQKKMAKLMMLQRRRTSLVEGKVNFIMKFSQSQNLPLSPAQSFSQKWNLQEIAQDYREEQDLNDETQRSNDTTLLQSEMPSKANMDGLSVTQFNLSDKSIGKSICSNAQITRPKRAKKQKSGTNSQIINQSRKQSFLSKINLNQEGANASNYQGDSDKEDESNGRQLKMTAQQINNIQRIVKKQTNGTNNNTVKQANPTKLSIFALRRKTTNVIQFSKDKTDKNSKQSRPRDSRGEKAKIKGSFRVSSSNKMEREQISRVILQCRRTESSQKKKKAGSRLFTQQDQFHPSSTSLKSIPSIRSSESDKASVQAKMIKVKQCKEVETETDPTRLITLSPNEYNMVIYPCEKQSEMIQTDASENRSLRIYQQDQMNTINLWYDRYSEGNKGNNYELNNPNSFQTGANMFLQKSCSSMHLRLSKQNTSEAILRYIKRNTCNDVNDSDEENNQKYSQQQHTLGRQSKGKTWKQQNRQSNYEKFGEKYDRQQNIGQEGRNSIKSRLYTTPAQQQEQQIKQLTIKCRTLQQFKLKISKLHVNKCGKTCPHLQKFVASFLRQRQTINQKMNLHISNIHESISQKIEPLPLLRIRKEN